MNEKELKRIELAVRILESVSHGDIMFSYREYELRYSDVRGLIADVRRLQSELAQRDPAWRG